MTKLLNTAIIGCNAARVDSSRIDMLAGLSKCSIFSTPPDFCALAGPAATSASSDRPAIARPCPNGFIKLLPCMASHRPGVGGGSRPAKDHLLGGAGQHSE